MEVPIQVGQVYQSSRGVRYSVDYIDQEKKDIMLLFDGTHTRMEPVEKFRNLANEGMFELLEDVEMSSSDTEIPLEDISHIGSTTSESMRENGYTSPRDLSRVNDERILEECRGLGEAGLSNIYEWIEEND